MTHGAKSSGLAPFLRRVNVFRYRFELILTMLILCALIATHFYIS
ncbi:hypothetical protein AM352_15765 [Citrobacter koseri]|nr:hypothetical protein AM352_15765 [Citrobacter koseri]